ncbi:Proteasome assembly chaperone 4, partial [Teratosphaeria destructans]
VLRSSASCAPNYCQDQTTTKTKPPIRPPYYHPKMPPNGTSSSPPKPLELALTLPSNPSTKIHLHLTHLPTSLLLLLTTTTLDAPSHATATNLGTLIYAMPDRHNPSQPLSTPLYTSASSQDFATRLAKVLVRRTGKLCYVGGGINLRDAAGGGTVDEEMEAFRAVVDVVCTANRQLEGA